MILKHLIVLLMTVAMHRAQRIGPLIKNSLRRDISSRDYATRQSQQGRYLTEYHNVMTRDGYVLQLNRIVSNATRTSCRQALPPVYLFHGLLENADIWLVAGPGRALGYLLADQGYDVWLGNARGTTFSRRHRSLNPDGRKFWDFTWHEIGVYDNPANIDYILSRSGHKKLHYIGHSQGTTTFFVMLSLLPEYNAKIKTMHALAPVTFMKYTTSPYFTLPVPFIDGISRIAERYGLEEYFPNSQVFTAVQRLCKSKNPDMNLCYQLLAFGGGSNPKQLNRDTLYKFFKYSPAGASIYQALHYSQLVLNGKFQSYDYGVQGNLQRYRQYTPIEYPLDKVTVSPIYLHVSRNDLISNLRDVKTLVSKLPQRPHYIEVADKQWTHFDYLIGTNAKELVYDRLISDIRTADRVICGNQIR